MSKRIIITLSLLLLCFEFLVSQHLQIKKIDGSKITAAEAEKVIERLMEKGQVTGLGISVFNENKVIYKKAFGLRKIDTNKALHENDIFYGASLSKAVFAVLVMQLVEEGVISLDVPLQNYLDKALPDYKFTKSWKGYHDLKDDKRYEEITARMCLTHSTGFPNWRFLTSNGFDREGKLYFQFDPGERYSYSGEGLSLLQFVLE